MSIRPPEAPPSHPTRPTTRPDQGTRGTWALRDRPGIVWLVLAGLTTLVHPFVPSSRWLMVHLVLLGAVTHSILVWSTHFTQALLKTPTSIDDRRKQSIRLSLNIIGVTLVLVGVPTAMWPVTVVGAALFSVAVLWHGAMLWRRLRRALPGRFRVTIHYYLAAAVLIPVGATFGVLLARGLDDEGHGRMLLAHTMTMVLGWIGLTVTGTLVTLWPTMLRTRMDDRAERLARQALPALLIAILTVVTGAVVGHRALSAAGLALYAAGLLWWGRALWRPARQAPPKHFATWSIAAGLVWAVAGLGLVTATVAGRPSWAAVGETYGRVTTVIVVGFALQLVTGALSHLVPAVIGGGPSVVRAAGAEFDRLAVWRIVVINVGLLVCLLPVPSVVRVIVSTLVLVALLVFIPLMFRAVRAAVAARRALVAGVADAVEHGRTPARVEAQRPVWSTGQFVGALATILIGVSLGIAVDPSAAGFITTGSGVSAAASDPKAPFAGSGAIAPTGATTTVRVEARDMTYSPSSITVPAGNRLVIELVNVDQSSPHDLAFSGALKTPRIMPGKTATIDVGVVAVSGEGWCTIVGHRQMGMVLTIVAEGGEAPGTTAATGNNTGTSGETGLGTTAATGNNAGIRLGQRAGPDFRAVDATLPPLTTPNGATHEITLTVEETVLEVAPGVRQKRWTYNGQVPGPTLHGRVGDTFVVTLVNKGSMGHSIDFHAGERAPDEVMRTVPPGESLTYRFTAARAGIWMYHCSTMPMSAHIAAGMHGAVIIEPDDLPAVDRNYVLVQSEAYVDGAGEKEPAEVDAGAAAANLPDAITFNGIANQYDASPLSASVGDRVRLWLLAAGPNRGSDFHVVGSQFDTVYAEGGYLLRQGRDAFGSSNGGSQVLSLGAAQGGFVELVPTEPGNYPFVTHAMADAEKGAHGILTVK
jgi:nitrite reductase (NO-forming)